MTRHFPATVPPRTPATSVVNTSPCRDGGLEPYRYREDICEECDEGRLYDYDSDGPYQCAVCDLCEGSGMVEATCDECDRLVPLNDEGICERCVDSNDLTVEEFAAKHHPHIVGVTL